MSTPELVPCGRAAGPPASPVCPLLNFAARPLHAFGTADGHVVIQMLRASRSHQHALLGHLNHVFFLTCGEARHQMKQHVFGSALHTGHA